MAKVYSNTTPRDTVRNAFYNNLTGVIEVSIASPFFSYSELVEEALKGDRFVRLIVVQVSKAFQEAGRER